MEPPKKFESFEIEDPADQSSTAAPAATKSKPFGWRLSKLFGKTKKKTPATATATATAVTPATATAVTPATSATPAPTHIKKNAIAWEIGIQFSTDLLKNLGQVVPIAKPICGLLSILVKAAAVLTDGVTTVDEELMKLRAKMETVKTCYDIMRQVYLYQETCAKSGTKTQFVINELHIFQIKRLVGELVTFLFSFLPDQYQQPPQTRLGKLWRFLRGQGYGCVIEYVKPRVNERMQDLIECVFTIQAEANIDLGRLLGENPTFHDQLVSRAATEIRGTEGIPDIPNDAFQSALENTSNLRVAMDITLNSKSTVQKDVQQIENLQQEIAPNISEETKQAVEKLENNDMLLIDVDGSDAVENPYWMFYNFDERRQLAEEALLLGDSTWKKFYREDELEKIEQKHDPDHLQGVPSIDDDMMVFDKGGRRRKERRRFKTRRRRRRQRKQQKRFSKKKNF
jgi:hypothetical protein